MQASTLNKLHHGECRHGRTNGRTTPKALIRCGSTRSKYQITDIPEWVPVHLWLDHTITIIDLAVACHCFLPGPQLPSTQKDIIAALPVANYTAWWQRQVNNHDTTADERYIQTAIKTYRETVTYHVNLTAAASLNAPLFTCVIRLNLCM